MNAERFMVTGTQIFGNGKITGFLMISDNTAYIFPHPQGKQGNPDKDVTVDLKTVEPVAVKMHLNPIYENPESSKIVGYDPLCPNCDCVFDYDEGQPEYCVECGQRLDWSNCHEADI